MKTFKTTTRFTFIKLPVYVIVLLLMISNQLQAQHKHHSNNEQVTKNVYLSMMNAMMADMHNIPVGNTLQIVFLQQMIPHHEGALVMAKYEIAHGKNKKMIQLAKDIVAEQKSEIKQMQLWLKQAIPESAKLPQSFMDAMSGTMTTMMNSMPKEHELTDTDRAFAAVMKPHHQAAIDMAKVLLHYSTNDKINAYARLLIANQQAEVNQMSNFLN